MQSMEMRLLRGEDEARLDKAREKEENSVEFCQQVAENVTTAKRVQIKQPLNSDRAVFTGMCWNETLRCQERMARWHVFEMPPMRTDVNRVLLLVKRGMVVGRWSVSGSCLRICADRSHERPVWDFIMAWRFT